jgi:hypothetical protein
MLVKEKTVKSKNVKTNSIYKNMFVELFYPKELRRLIEKYRKEGTLNEVALSNINKMIKKSAIIGLIIFILFISESLFAFIFFSISIFSTWIDFHLFTRKRIYYPYSFGQLTKVRVKTVTKYAVFTGKIKLVCENLETSEKLIIGPLYGTFWEKNINLKKDDLVNVWYSAKCKKYAMPDIFSLKLNYSLTTSIL